VFHIFMFISSALVNVLIDATFNNIVYSIHLFSKLYSGASPLALSHCVMYRVQNICSAVKTSEN